MTEPLIDTRVLPPHVAAVVRDVVADLIDRHPRLTAFQLGGSYWNPSSQLPDADIDLRRFGEVDPAAGDFRVASPIVLFHYGGQLFEFAEWVFRSLEEPDALSLRDAISVARAHVLWERGSRLRDQTAAAAQRLRDARWRRRAFEQLFTDCESSFREMAAANEHLGSLRKPPGAVTDDAYFKHVFYRLVDPLSGLISAIDLRPPSLARKAMMEIADCLAAIGLPELTEQVYEALGCRDFSDAECVAWRDELTEVYALTAAAADASDLPKRRYHLTGIAAMLQRGHARAAIFPIWRGLEECRRASERTRNAELRERIYRDLTRLRVRLAFESQAEVRRHIELCIDALASLHVHRERLYEYLEMKIADWTVARKAV